MIAAGLPCSALLFLAVHTFSDPLSGALVRRPIRHEPAHQLRVALLCRSKRPPSCPSSTPASSLSDRLAITSPSIRVNHLYLTLADRRVQLCFYALPIQHQPTSHITMATAFSSSIDQIKREFCTRYSHLPEEQRQQLWLQTVALPSSSPQQPSQSQHVPRSMSSNDVANMTQLLV